MKILYLLKAFPNVSETFIFNEINELCKQNIEIQILSLYTPEKSAEHEGINEFTKNTLYYDRLSKLKKIQFVLYGFVFSFFIIYRLLKLNQEYKFNFKLSRILKHILPLVGFVHHSSISHIHCHFADINTKYAFLISKVLNITYSFTAHGYDIYFQPPEQYPALISDSSFCLTVSQANRKILIEQYGSLAEKFRVLPMGINIEFFKRDNNILRNNKAIITVARLVPVKALEYAIEAAAILKKRNYSFQWIFVGEGSERNRLQGLINSNGLQNYTVLVGNKTDKEVRDLLSELSIFVLSSVSEGLGVCLMEALAMECAVVATNVGGIGEVIINNETGILVEPRSSIAIASAIEYFFENDSEIVMFSKNGRDHIVNHFNIANQCKLLANLFSTLKYR